MSANKYHFRLFNGRVMVFDCDCTFEEIRRMGDNMATCQHQRLKVQAFNEPLDKWDFLGYFAGNMEFDNWDGQRWVINEDYKGMTLKTGKEVAV